MAISPNERDYIYFSNVNDFIPTDVELETESETIKKLNKIYESPHDNSKIYDRINYEYLIFIELKYIDNKEIQDIITKIKRKISNNYLAKEKGISRLCMKNNILNDRRLVPILFGQNTKKEHANTKIKYMYEALTDHDNEAQE